MALAASTDDSLAPKPRLYRQLPPITPEGLGGCFLWLLGQKSGRKSDDSLLIRGLPQGRIKSARVVDSNTIGVVFEDQRNRDGTRGERLFDREGFCAVRLLCAPKTYVRVDHNMPRRHFVTLFDDITAQRVIAGARRNEAVRQLGDHHDLRRANLILTPAAGRGSKRVHQDRSLTAKLSLEAYDRLPERHWLRKLVLRKDLEGLFAECFRLLDRRPLGSQAENSEEWRLL